MEKEQKIVKVDGEKLKKKLAELNASMHKISLYILGKSRNYLCEGLTRGFIQLEEVEKIAKFYGLNANDYFMVEEPKKETKEPPQERAEAPNVAFNDENILIHLSKIERLLIEIISATKRNTIELEKHTMELKNIKAMELKNIKAKESKNE